MHISDWSSDVCSSDLHFSWPGAGGPLSRMPTPARRKVRQMDEEIFNMELRKFLKKVGVTSQREIETAVRDAQIGRASCRVRVSQYVSLSVVAVSLKTKNKYPSKLGNTTTRQPS